MTLELYDCGCKFHCYEADNAEMPSDSYVPLTIQDFRPCHRHRHSREVPPRDARLLKVQGENEAFLNE